MPIIAASVAWGSFLATETLPFYSLIVPLFWMVFTCRKMATILLWAVFWLSLTLSFIHTTSALSHPFFDQETVVSLDKARIIGIGKTAAKHQVYKLRDLKTQTAYHLHWPTHKKSLRNGDELSGTFHRKKIQPATNPGQFNYKRWLHYKGLSGVLKPNRVKRIKKGSPYQPKNLAKALQTWLGEAIKKVLPQPHASLLLGLLIGITDPPLPEGIQNNFQKTGLTHLLVVSGAQIALISGICLQLLSFIGLKKRYQWVTLVIINGFFCMITGLEASILRAVLMFQLGLFFKWQQYPIRFIHLFSTVFIGLYLWDPLIVFDIGAQLSISATLGILFLVPKIEALGDSLSIPRWLNQPISLSLGPFIMTAPLLWYHFQTLSPIALLANTLILYPTEWIVILGALACIAAPLSTTLLKGFSTILYGCLSVILWIIEQLANLPGQVYLAAPHVLIICALYLALFHCLSRTAKLHHFLRYCILFLIILVITSLKERPFMITFLDVGQGDATLIQTPDRRYYLIDTGPKGVSYSAAASVILPTLKYWGINRLDGLIITHFDTDHVGGAAELLKKIPTGFVWDNRQRYSKNKDYHTTIDQLDIPKADFKVGQTYTIGKQTTLTPLWPLPHNAPAVEENNNSICFRIDFGEIGILFTGDLEAFGEIDLIRHWGTALDIDILKVGHHGSLTSTIPPFLEVTSPEIAIISAGRNNRYNHPHPTVIQRLSKKGITIRTTQTAAVTYRYYDEL